MSRILVAGIGNIFMGDDAFGCEVAWALARKKLPEGVRVVDYGIRGYDLACALTEEHEAVILLDATPRGEPPGTTYLMEIEVEDLAKFDAAPLDAHSLNPVSVLQMAQSSGGIRGKVYLVGCEPEVLESDGGDLGLSDSVRAAIPQAMEMVESLVSQTFGKATKTAAGLSPA